MVLVEGRCTDATQVTARQCRFQDVCGIHGTAALAGTHKGVNLVDKQDDFALSLSNLVDDRFESFLKLALILGAGNQCAHVERIDLFHLQVFGYIAAHDTLCQALNDGGFACARLADEDRVVLGASAQDLQHSTDFVITTDDRVEFALTGTFVKVDGILAQSIVLLLSAL